mmetsp:Transcript_4896/g.9114  ORF Transcript_4896/g.9114 Transcript_4896/m.9114 type:complete len:222 (+) Transcript_4896:394-1059(+)
MVWGPLVVDGMPFHTLLLFFERQNNFVGLQLVLCFHNLGSQLSKRQTLILFLEILDDQRERHFVIVQLDVIISAFLSYSIHSDVQLDNLIFIQECVGCNVAFGIMKRRCPLNRFFHGILCRHRLFHQKFRLCLPIPFGPVRFVCMGKVVRILSLACNVVLEGRGRRCFLAICSRSSGRRHGHFLLHFSGHRRRDISCCGSCCHIFSCLFYSGHSSPFLVDR